MSSSSPCRLFVYLAHEAPIGVVLRRGPSEWARLSLWHTDTDTFEHGQWIKARVYERRSDLSPDGRLFVAFVRQSGGGRGEQAKIADSWVAVSRPPYFSALAVWSVGGTYHTGGFFPSARSLWAGFTDAGPDIGETPPWLSLIPPREIAYIDGTNEWPERTVHFNRLLRDAWRLIEERPYETMWERDHPSQSMSLVMKHRFQGFEVYGGPYTVDYAIRRDDEETDLGQATWADWDQNGRLVIAHEGRLLLRRPSGELIEIEDFNGQTPDPAPAASWALEWPPAPS